MTNHSTPARRWRYLVAAALLVVGVAVFTHRGTSAWSASFCQPMRIVIDAGNQTGTGAKSTPAVARFLNIEGLRREVRVALSHAPTQQLRRELGSYEVTLSTYVQGYAVVDAIHTFSLEARSQVGRCGFRPSNG